MMEFSDLKPEAAKKVREHNKEGLIQELPTETIASGDIGLPASIVIGCNQEKKHKLLQVIDESYNNFGWDDKKHHLLVKKGDVLSGRYEVESHLGAGAFGKVVKALDKSENQFVAVKIIRNLPHLKRQAQIEMAILEKIKLADSKNILPFVQIQGDFLCQNHVCLVFEVLSLTLFSLLEKSDFQGFSLLLTRKFGYQLCEALDFLARPSINVIHSDLKPENIMLCYSNSTRIKVVDFGSAFEVGKCAYVYLQSRFYRSPEVQLGIIPYSPAIDMWSLGCVLVELHTGSALFNGDSENDQLMIIVQTLGIPPAHMLENGSKTNRYFTKNSEGEYVKIPDSTKKHARGIATRKLCKILGVTTGGPTGQRLKGVKHSEEYANTFQDLVSGMLDFDPNTRMSTKKALEHSFFQTTDIRPPGNPELS